MGNYLHNNSNFNIFIMIILRAEGIAVTSSNKRPVNLLFISDLFYPYIGGAEKSALITLTHVAKFGIKINVLTNLLDGQSNVESYNNIMIYREKLFSQQSLDFIHRFLLYVRSIPIIIKYVMVLKPNIIISQQLISLDILHLKLLLDTFFLRTGDIEFSH